MNSGANENKKFTGILKQNGKEVPNRWLRNLHLILYLYNGFNNLNIPP
jgi:hypothetical protein